MTSGRIPWGHAGACIRLIDAARDIVSRASLLVAISPLEGRTHFLPHRVESGIIS